MRYSFDSQKGAALIETVLVFGLLITLSFGGIELARTIRLQMALNNLALSAADTARRDCADLMNVTDRQSCLDATAQRILLLGSTTIGSDFTSSGSIVLTIWKNNNATSFDSRSTAGQSGVVSRIPGTANYSGFIQVVSSEPSVVTAEVFYSYQPLTPVWLILHEPGNGTLYEHVVI